MMDTSGSQEYLLKWQGLSYSDCTWEDAELVQKRFQEAIDAYKLRNKSQSIPTKYCKVLYPRSNCN